MRKTSVLVAVALGFLVAAGAVWGAMDFYLKIDGIPGESNDDKHQDEIEVLSWTWGATNTTTIVPGGGASAGRVDFQPLTITKYLDKSSPTLFLRTADGKFLQKAILTSERPGVGAGGFKFLVMTLESLFVTSYSVGAQANGEDNLPVENISFGFGKVRMEYFIQKADGSPGGSVVADWDLLKSN
jgi:type VI secretion system secreted protein Hcp